MDYRRRVRNVDKVSIISWSRGGPRAGGYVAQHPEKVARLFLYAPAFNKLLQDNPPARLPLAGVPYNVLGSADFHNLWSSQVKCESQFTPQIRPVITSTLLDFDPLGSTWGSGGLRRAPNWPSPSWGWNAQVAARVKVPTLVIWGDLDTQIPQSQIIDLLGALVAAPQKMFVHVACASHYLVWENQHMSLLNASIEWFSQGTYMGQYSSSFFVDTAGKVHNEQPVVSGFALSTAIVKPGDSYTATITGTNLTEQTYFDLRFRVPGGTVDLEALNWQQGTRGSHKVTADSPQGLWTITGIRARENAYDHSGNYSPISVQLTIKP